MRYVLIHNGTGKYVSRPGSEHSYTNKLQNAATYPTRDAAEANRCPGSEHIVSLDQLFPH